MRCSRPCSVATLQTSQASRCEQLELLHIPCFDGSEIIYVDGEMDCTKYTRDQDTGPGLKWDNAATRSAVVTLSPSLEKY